MPVNFTAVSDSRFAVEAAGRQRGTPISQVAGIPAAAAAARRTQGFPPPVLRHRNFALFFFSLLFSNTGTWMAATAQSWLVYDLTGSAVALGAVLGVFAFPMIVLPFFGGVIADRVDRRRLLWITQTFAMAVALVLALLVAAGLVAVWHIIVISFVSAIALAFDQPARQALLPDLVPRDELRAAVAINSAVYTGGAFLGPALAGVLVARAGLPLAGVFFINAASFGAVMVALAFMRIPAFDPARQGVSVGRTALEGLRYVRRSEVVLMVMLLSMVASLFGRSYQILAPVYAKDILRVGIEGLGLMSSLPGAGSILGAVLVGMNLRLPRNGVLGLAATGASAALLLVYAGSEVYVLSLGALFLLGFVGTLQMTATRTILQLSSPRELMGRVMSVSTIAVIGFGPLGGFVVGPLAEVTSAPIALYLSAGVVLAALALLATVRPALRRAE